MEGTLGILYGIMEKPLQDDSLLYHYCSMDSFYKIISSGKVWLGNLTMMNDPSEMLIGKINIGNEILKLYKEDPFDFICESNNCALDMAGYLECAIIGSSLTKSGQFSKLFHALCFSSKADDLSQWRLYGDNGKGVCIGFSRECLSSFVNSNRCFCLQEIEYYTEFNQIVAQLARAYLDQIRSLYESRKNQELLQLKNKMNELMVDYLTKFKICDYQGENETRLIHVIQTGRNLADATISIIAKDEFMKELTVVQNDNSIKTYIEVPIKDLGITSVSLGPCNDNSKLAMNLLLAKYKVDIDKNKIFKSQIPYRG